MAATAGRRGRRHHDRAGRPWSVGDRRPAARRGGHLDGRSSGGARRRGDRSPRSRARAFGVSAALRATCSARTSLYQSARTVTSLLDRPRAGRGRCRDVHARDERHPRPVLTDRRTAAAGLLSGVLAAQRRPRLVWPTSGFGPAAWSGSSRSHRSSGSRSLRPTSSRSCSDRVERGDGRHPDPCRRRDRPVAADPSAEVLLRSAGQDWLFRFTFSGSSGASPHSSLGLQWGVVGVATCLVVPSSSSRCGRYLATRALGSRSWRFLGALSGVAQAAAVMGIAASRGAHAPGRSAACPRRRLAMLAALGVVVYVAACLWRAPEVARASSRRARRQRRNEPSHPLTALEQRA